MCSCCLCFCRVYIYTSHLFGLLLCCIHCWFHVVLLVHVLYFHLCLVLFICLCVRFICLTSLGLIWLLKSLLLNHTSIHSFAYEVFIGLFTHCFAYFFTCERGYESCLLQ